MFMFLLNSVQKWLLGSFYSFSYVYTINSLSTNFIKWSNTLTQFVGKLPTNRLSVFDHFVGFALKGFSQYIPLSRIRDNKSLKIVIHQIDSKSEWLLLSADFTAKFGLVFVLKLENAFS